MRALLVSFLIIAVACSRADSGGALDSAELKTTAATSTDSAPRSAIDSASTSPMVIAQWRGSQIPDKLDTLMADAFNAGGTLTETEEEYGFLRSDSALIQIGKQPGGIKRLVDCLEWDRRALAQVNNQRILVGVLCLQGILRSRYGQHLAGSDIWPANVGEGSTIEDYRRARLEFLRIMQDHPPERDSAA